MNMSNDNVGTQPAWFVGASYGDTDDQTPRFLADGVFGSCCVMLSADRLASHDSCKAR